MGFFAVVRLPCPWMVLNPAWRSNLRAITARDRPHRRKIRMNIWRPRNLRWAHYAKVIKKVAKNAERLSCLYQTSLLLSVSNTTQSKESASVLHDWKYIWRRKRVWLGFFTSFRRNRRGRRRRGKSASSCTSSSWGASPTRSTPNRAGTCRRGTSKSPRRGTRRWRTRSRSVWVYEHHECVGW